MGFRQGKVIVSERKKRYFLCEILNYMRGKFLFLMVLGLVLSLSGCKDKEVIIPDNIAPPDNTITDLELESYINRSYIQLLGRKPESAEFTQGVTTLRTNNASESDRENFLSGIMSEDGYWQNLFDQSRTHLLDGTDTTSIRDQINIFDILLGDTQYQALWPLIQAERDRLSDILAIPSQLKAGTIDEVEMHRRLIYNYMYDQLNMGTQNFVIATFQNFLFRYPTASELERSETMVNGFASELFFETGDSKEDFLLIFFASTDYYEGQVRDLFQRYLYREPGSGEMETLATDYENSGDYQTLQVHILKSREYAGF